jgi:hypothetical protein
LLAPLAGRIYGHAPQQNAVPLDDPSGMPITVVIEDENGNRIAGPWEHALSSAALANPEEDTCCLQFVDPYGDTVFNQLQIPTLRLELMHQILNVENPEFEPVLDSLIKFLKRAEGQVHTYARFIGD